MKEKETVNVLEIHSVSSHLHERCMAMNILTTLKAEIKILCSFCGKIKRRKQLYSYYTSRNSIEDGILKVTESFLNGEYESTYLSSFFDGCDCPCKLNLKAIHDIRILIPREEPLYEFFRQAFNPENVQYGPNFYNELNKNFKQLNPKS